MATTMTLLQALAELDPNDSGNWTTSGSPRLDILKEKTGLELDRKQVTEAAPEFSKDNPVLPVSTTNPWDESGAATGFTDPDTDAEKADDLDSGDNADEATNQSLTEPTQETEIDETEKQELQRKIDEANKEVNEANKKLAAAVKAMDVFIEANENPQSKTRHAFDIKSFQQSQYQQRAAQNMTTAQLEELLRSVAK